MNRRHLLATLGVSGLCGSVIVGSTAFSESTTKRQISLAVADDEDAFLSLEFPADPVNVGETFEIAINNQAQDSFNRLKISFDTADTSIGDNLSVNIQHSPANDEFVADSGSDPEVILSSGQFGIGSEVTVSVTVEAVNQSTDAPLLFDVVAESNGGLLISTDPARRVIITND